MKRLQGLGAAAGSLGRCLMLIAMVAVAINLGGCHRKKVSSVDTTAGMDNATRVPRAGDTGMGTAPDVDHPPIVVDQPIAGMEVIYFDFDKSTIRKDQMARVEGDLKFLKDHPAQKVMIVGHCDERGTVEYNFSLGERRARTVADYFAKNGVAGDRMNIQSKGEEEPVDAGHNEAAWAKNRRAEFLGLR